MVDNGCFLLSAPPDDGCSIFCCYLVTWFEQTTHASNRISKDTRVNSLKILGAAGEVTEKRGRITGSPKGGEERCRQLMYWGCTHVSKHVVWRMKASGCVVSQPVSALMPHPSLERWCLKKSLAANLMAFSGVTSVRFTAAPVRIEGEPQRRKTERQNKRLNI